MKRATMWTVILFAVWLVLATGLTLFANRAFFDLEAVFITAWVFLGLLFWASGVLRPGGGRRPQ